MLELTNRKMIESAGSDFNPTMAVCEALENVLNCVKTSNLNFCLQLSPFSAKISIKNRGKITIHARVHEKMK